MEKSPKEFGLTVKNREVIKKIEHNRLLRAQMEIN